MKHFLVLILVCSANCCFCQSSVACDRTSDSLELVNFFQVFKGTTWILRDNWLVPGKPLNTWYGIRLNTSGCVESLDLDSNNVKGILYNINLPNLRILSLKYNQISGSIPDFSKLPELNQLYLSHNQLTGSIPNFYYFQKLTDLYLNSNLLNGTISDYNRMLSLKIINFSDNQLTGEIPDFSGISKLVELDLGFNLLEGPIPNFSKTPNLIVLVAHANKLNGPVPDFSRVPKLQWIMLAYNQLSGTVPDFSKIPIMFQISLAGNQLTGTIPNFSNMPNLGYIYLSNNRLTGNIPNFTNLNRMLIMNFSYNQLTGSISNLSKVNTLYRLQLGGNLLSGIIPDLKLTHPNLSELELYSNELSGPIPDFSNFSSFDIWDNKFTFTDILSSNNLAGTGFTYETQKLFYQDTVIKIQKNTPIQIDLGIDANLNDNFYSWYKNKFFWSPPSGNNNRSNKLIFNNPQAIDAGRYFASVSNNRVSGLTLYSHSISLRVCDEQKDSLELIKLFQATNGVNWKNSNNWLQSGKRINTWYGVTSDAFGCVQKLDLSGNNLKGILPIMNMNTLDTLILNNNFIAGELPELKTPFIRVLEINNNELVGDFPQDLKNWTDLRELDMSFNRISGAVPPDMGDLCELNTLRLNNNKISGELPEQLSMLSKLQIGQVDFSDNQIDSLKDKLIWFCPFGDSILQLNPSYDRFLGICNVQCSGTEFSDLKSFPWITDTVNHLICNDKQCALVTAQAGFVNVRGVKVFYTFSRCYYSLTPPPIYSDIVNFYDCGGHLIERVEINADSFHTTYGAISQMDFENLNYETKWQCGDSLGITTSINETNPKYDSRKHLSTSTFTMDCSPNPATWYIHCTTDETIVPESIQVNDLIGREYLIPNQIIKDQIRLDVSKLPKGIYIVSANGKNKRYLAKVLIP